MMCIKTHVCALASCDRREWGVGVAENKSEDQCASNPQIFYDLFATVNHRGTLHQGHYTAYVKCGDSWYLCNDAFVTNAGVGDGEKEVLSSEGAYMLFYQKKKRLTW
jgi:ubiquitin C-terminal hydrolase